MVTRRLKYWFIDRLTRRGRIERGMLTGRYTINEGRALLGLPLFTDGHNAWFANQRFWVSPHGVIFREMRNGDV